MLLLGETSEWTNGAENHRHKERLHRATGAGSSTTLMTVHPCDQESDKKKPKEGRIHQGRECMARNPEFLTQWSASREKLILLLPFLLFYPCFIPCYDAILIGCLSFPHRLTLGSTLTDTCMVFKSLGDLKPMQVDSED